MAEPVLQTGYSPGAIAAVIALHAKYYAAGLQFGLPFEASLAIELSSFLLNLDESKDCFLLATIDGAVVGSITVDGRTLGPEEAQLRWFVVSPDVDGGQIDSILMKQALSFCAQKKYQRVSLLTLAGSDLARRLEAEWGFRQVSEHVASEWGRPIKEDAFELRLQLPEETR